MKDKENPECVTRYLVVCVGLRERLAAFAGWRRHLPQGWEEGGGS